MAENSIFDDVSLNYYKGIIQDAGGYDATLNKIRWSMHNAGNRVFFELDPELDPKKILDKFKPSELYKSADMFEGIYAGTYINKFLEKQPLLKMPMFAIGQEVRKDIGEFYPADFAHSIFGHVIPMLKHNPSHEVLAYYISEPTLLKNQSWGRALAETVFHYDIRGSQGSNPFKKAYEAGKFGPKQISGYSFDNMIDFMTLYGSDYSLSGYFKDPEKNLYANPIYSGYGEKTSIQFTAHELIETYAAALTSRIKFETHPDNNGKYDLSQTRMYDLKNLKGSMLLLQEKDVDAVRNIVGYADLSDNAKAVVTSKPESKVILQKVDNMRRSLEASSAIIF